MFIVECETQLYQLEQIDIALQELVLVVRSTPELPNWFGHYPWELCVLEHRDRDSK